MNFGSGYIGSADIETSVAEKEIIPLSPYGEQCELYKFSLENIEACHVLINGYNTPIFLKAGQGFNVNKNDRNIESFKIVEDGIHFNWIGA